MKLEIIRLIAKIHYGDKEVQNRQILDKAIQNMNLSEDEKIFINVFTKKLDKIVMDYSFASDLMKIRDEGLLALAAFINYGTIEFSGFTAQEADRIFNSRVRKLTENAGERYGRIQNWMSEEDIKREIFGGDLKPSRLFLYHVEIENGEANFYRMKTYNFNLVYNRSSSAENYLEKLDIQDLLQYHLYSCQNKEFSFLSWKLKELMICSRKMNKDYLNIIKVYSTDKISISNPYIITKIIQNHWNKYYLGDGKFKENDEYGAIEFIQRAYKKHYGHGETYHMVILGLLPNEIMDFYRKYYYKEFQSICAYNNAGYLTMNVILNRILNQEERDFVLSYAMKKEIEGRYQLVKTDNEEFSKALDSYDTRRQYALPRYLEGFHNHLKEYLENDAIINTNILNNKYREDEYVNNLKLHMNSKNAVELLRYHSLFLKRNHPGIYNVIIDSLKIHSKEDLDVFVQQHGIDNVMWNLMKTEYLSHKTKIMLIKSYLKYLEGSIQVGYNWANIENHVEIMICKKAFQMHNINLIDYLSEIKKEIKKSKDKQTLYGGWKIFSDFELPELFFE